MLPLRRSHVFVSLLLVLPFGYTTPAPADPAPEGPSLGGAGLGTRLRYRVRLSAKLASRQLDRLPACRALFEPYGKNGSDLLGKARIVAADHTPHAHLCRSEGVAMVTTVRGSVIGVCPDALGHLPVTETAARLLHELLHHAGMRERPQDPEGLLPEQITRLVKRACRL